MNKSITDSSIILYLTNGSDSIYLKVQHTNGRLMNLSINSQTFLTDAKITGYCRPTMTYSWASSVINTLDNQETIIKQQMNLSQREAYIVRHVVSKDFHCHLLLLQDNKLNNIAKINQKILLAKKKPKNIQMQRDYTAICMEATTIKSIYPTAPLL